MKCRCGELEQCRRDSERLYQAQVKLEQLGTSSRIVWHQSGRIALYLEDTYTARTNDRAAHHMDTEKKQLDFWHDSAAQKIQSMREELVHKIFCLSREDEQFHMEEARKRQEEETRRKREEEKWKA